MYVHGAHFYVGVSLLATAGAVLHAAAMRTLWLRRHAERLPHTHDRGGDIRVRHYQTKGFLRVRSVQCSADQVSAIV